MVAKLVHADVAADFTVFDVVDNEAGSLVKPLLVPSVSTELKVQPSFSSCYFFVIFLQIRLEML